MERMNPLFVLNKEEVIELEGKRYMIDIEYNHLSLSLSLVSNANNGQEADGN